MRQGLSKTARVGCFILGIALLSALGAPCLICAQNQSTAEQTLTEIQSLLEKGEYDAARPRLAQAVKEFPNEPGLYNFLGVVDAQAGDYPAAERDFRKAVEKDPRFKGAYLNLGRLYQQFANKDPQALKKGLDTYLQLLKVDPENVEARYQAGYVSELLGSYSSSLRQLARLSAETQKRAQVLSVFCADYAGLGDRVHADAVAEKLARSADLQEADVNSILPLLEKHQSEDLATRLLAALADRNLASTSSLFRLGILYEQQGKLQEARDTLEKVGLVDPNSVPLLMEARARGRQAGGLQGRVGLPGPRAPAGAPQRRRPFLFRHGLRGG